MLKIHEITLLSVQEYSQHQEYISHVPHSWWLKTPAVDGGQLCVSCVDDSLVDGVPRICPRYVRPALRISGMDLHPGDRVAIFAESWTALHVDETILVLCDRCLSFVAFDSNNKEFGDSDIQRWLNKYLKRRLQTQNLKTHKQLSKLNRARLAYLENPFWCEWAGPLCIAIPLCIVMTIIAQQVISVVIPNILCSVAFGIAMTCAVLGFLRAVFIGLSPHKDTMLAHLINALAICVLLAICWDTRNIVTLAYVTSATILYCINYRYLTAIKYYS